MAAMLVLPGKALPTRQDMNMNMGDFITVRGFVATDITTSTTPGGVATASFRIGSTGRRYDRSAGAWVDGHTNWFRVQGYRQLAGNLGCSIRKGQPVIVVGRLRMRSWEKDGRIYHSAEIDADSVGHDLTLGSANFIRTVKNSQQTAPDDALPAEDGSEAAGSVFADRDFAEEDGTPEDIMVEDVNGDYVSVDTETGELAGSAA
jgi:single-strand DNA-binding protein